MRYMWEVDEIIKEREKEEAKKRFAHREDYLGDYQQEPPQKPEEDKTPIWMVGRFG